MRQQLPQGECLPRAGIWFLSQAWVALALALALARIPLTDSQFGFHIAHGLSLFAWTLTLGPGCMLHTGPLGLSGY